MDVSNMKEKLKFILFALVAAFIVLPVHAQEEKTIKRKVAIGRFSNETQYGKGLFYDKENDPMRKQAMDILSSKLAASGKFILLERDLITIACTLCYFKCCAAAFQSNVHKNLPFHL